MGIFHIPGWVFQAGWEDRHSMVGGTILHPHAPTTNNDFFQEAKVSSVEICLFVLGTL